MVVTRVLNVADPAQNGSKSDEQGRVADTGTAGLGALQCGSRVHGIAMQQHLSLCAVLASEACLAPTKCAAVAWYRGRPSALPCALTGTHWPAWWMSRATPGRTGRAGGARPPSPTTRPRWAGLQTEGACSGHTHACTGATLRQLITRAVTCGLRPLTEHASTHDGAEYVT